MGRSNPVRSRSVKRVALITVSLFATMIAVPFLLNLAGDAQVHLAIAENFVRDMPFQFNDGGEIVVASTSPFWTIMLVFFYQISGSLAPLLLTTVVLLIWLGSAYLLYRAGKDLWNFPSAALWSLLLLWLLHTTIVANALGGLENALSALQLLLIYTLTARYRNELTWQRSLLLGLLLGWALLTRPDGGLFALILIALFIITLWPSIRQQPGTFASHLAIISGAALLVLLPWFAYQYSVTGRLITDSSIARLYNGRQGSLVLIPDLLYLHPKATISLGTAFLPLVAGFLVSSAELVYGFIRSPGARLQHYRGEYPRYAVVLLILTGLLFFTFVVGAESFGRYFLPLFPFLFLAGVDGWVRFLLWMEARGRRPAALVLVSLAVIFMIATSLYDLYRRLDPGHFNSDHVSNVIYGPANRQYYSVNLRAILEAPDRRLANSNELMAHLNATGNEELSIAVTEVQLRYFVDDRFDIISLDGRTSADIFDYVDPTTGVPDFERYFLEIQPDYVHANQWCAVGGWLAAFFTSAIGDNLVCKWEKQAEEMQPGDTFQWQGRQVTLAAPEILHIQWDDSD